MSFNPYDPTANSITRPNIIDLKKNQLGLYLRYHRKRFNQPYLNLIASKSQFQSRFGKVKDLSYI